MVRRPMLRVVLLLPLVLAPTAMVLISLAERRFGSSVAGWLNAVPLSISLAVLGVSADQGAPAGAAIAEAAAAHVPAQVAFAVAFAAVLRRWRTRGERAPRNGWRASAAGRRRLVIGAGLLGGTLAFVGLSALISLVPAPVSIAVALPALYLGRRALSEQPEAPAKTDSPVLVRAAVATAAVLAVLTTVRVAGPGLGGAVAAYPALTATLASTAGVATAARLLHGVVQGLTGYLAFCVALAASAPALGIASAGMVAVTACAAAFALTWGTVKNGTKMCASGPIETA
jgi:hypothetical protein